MGRRPPGRRSAAMQSDHSHLPHLRPFQKQPIVFLTVCAHERRPILANEHAHTVMRSIWTMAAGLYGWFVGRYVVMPDHVHLFVRAASDARPMARWIQAWKSLSSRAITVRTNCEPPIWQ